MADDIEAILGEHLTELASAPFLFVGSGFARRYLGLPDWAGLLTEFANIVKADFRYLLGKADGDLPVVASMIADQFYDVWWTDERYADSVEQWRDRVASHDLPLRIAISDYMTEASTQVDLTSGEYAEEIALLQEAVVDGVITTNWDLLLEQIFPQFKVFVGQEELLFGATQGIAEIYKIHGSCTQPDSLVLTRDDYDAFAARNPYLSARLLSIFVDHPVIFLGYSIADENIQGILSSIVACLSQAHLSRLQDRLIFVQRGKGEPEVRRVDQHFGSLRVPVLVVETQDFSPLYRALTKIERRFPARLLRALREQVYELVQTQEPTGRIFVEDIDNATNPADIDVVLGVGIRERLEDAAAKLGEEGYQPITRDRLLTDVLLDESELDPERVIGLVLPSIYRGNALAPCLSYLAAADYRIIDGSWNKPVDERIDRHVENIVNRLQPNTNASFLGYQRRAREAQESGDGLAAVLARDMPTCMQIASFLDLGSMNQDVLRKFLIEHSTEVLAGSANTKTWFARLVCIYDLLRCHEAVGVALEGPDDGTEDLGPAPS